MTSPYIYIPDVPQGSQQINNTTSPIEGNFEYISQLMAVNHVGFNTSNIFGNHTIVNYVQQENDPSTGSSEIALYSKKVDDENGIELFYRYPNNGTVNQLTGIGSSSPGSGSGGGSFSINTASITASLPNGGFGYILSGSWQYLSNGVLILNGVVGNYYTQTKPTSPYTITLPSGMVDINGVTIPSFKSTPFNVQMTCLSPQYGTNVNYAIISQTPTTSKCYFTGTFNNPPTTIASIYVTLIGV